MITSIEALRYRCLRYVRQPLGPFHVLVGPNASGKTTFLDVPAFVRDVISGGLERAMEARSPNLEDLLFNREGESFELALQVAIPRKVASASDAGRDCSSVRYELSVGTDVESGATVIQSESVRFQQEAEEPQQRQRTLFPSPDEPPESIHLPTSKGSRRGVSKSPTGSTNFYTESGKAAGKGWCVNFKLSPQASALGNLPEDRAKFPVCTWLKEFLIGGVQNIVLDSLAMRKASPPGVGNDFRTDGTNLPWVIDSFRTKNPDAFRDWVAHLQTTLTDLDDVSTVLRQDDRHRYLRLCYRGGLQLPSWMVSDGTLRLLALTLPAYLPDLDGVFLIEEPENGIHPRAIETVYQSLSNVYDAQILLATHSPVILGSVEPSQVLCFAKNENGATDIETGDRHPALADWQREPGLDVLFASGVLG